jgi:N-acetyl-gamma-glutamyl-phosphate reductase
MQTIKVGIIGAAGYTGGELIRLLIQHPYTQIAFAQSNSNAGKPVSHIHTDLIGDTNIAFTDNHHTNIDVLFLCSGHGEAKKFLEKNEIPSHIVVIDIGNDFRLQPDAVFANRTFVYGLPELNKETIISAKNIANPGCFATAIQLSLLPLAKAGLLHNVYTTGITGSTGAGQSLSATSHFSWRVNNIQAYKTLSHQHLGEIHQSIQQLQSNTKASVHFVPWRGDFARGIFVSSSIACTLSLQEAENLYINFYANAPFTHITQQPLHLKQVVNTNKCCIQIEKQNDILVVHAAIDNLLKGAVGQAIQNMNLIFGYKETTGLQLKATGF